MWIRVILVLVSCAACASSEAPAPQSHDASTLQGDAEQDASLEMNSDASPGGPAEGCPFSPPTVCPDPKPTYADVQPIFERRCTACHDGMQGQWPLTSYQHVADWFGEIRSQLIACTMPPVDSGLTMPVAERLEILTWIRCGFPR